MKSIIVGCLLLVGLISYSMDNPAPSLSTLPDTVKEAILRNLVSAKASTETNKLYKAVENIRSLLFTDKAFEQFNHDFAFNNFIITELAKRYLGNNTIKAALALNTAGAGLWLQTIIKDDEDARIRLIIEFVDAAASGQIEIIRFLLKYAGDYKDIAQYQGFTPLKAAAVYNRKEVVLELLKAGAFPSSDSLFLAAQKGNIEIVKILLTHNAAPAKANDKGDLPLHVAAQNGHTKVVELLLSSRFGPQMVNMANRQGVTPLIAAANEGHVDVVNALLKAGAQPNLKTLQNASALWLAAQNGHLDVVQKLLAADADINAVGPGGMTPLMTAANNKRTKIANLLIRSKANYELRNDTGATAFIFAAQSGDLETVELLLRMGVNINQADSNGNNALIAAIVFGHLPVVKKLISAKIDVKHKNNAGQTALDIARTMHPLNEDAIVKLLEQAEGSPAQT